MTNRFYISKNVLKVLLTEDTKWTKLKNKHNTQGLKITDEKVLPL